MNIINRLLSHTQPSDMPSFIIQAASAVNDIFKDQSLPNDLSDARLQNVSLEFYKGCSLPPDLQAWMLKCVTSLRPMYENSKMGWDIREKTDEFCHPDQRFLVATHESALPDQRIAFVCFRWDVEEAVPILYLYELFVDNQARGMRIGFALMHFVERLCLANHVFCIMLTVFDENAAAKKLYLDSLG